MIRHNTFAEISLSALTHNLRVVQEKTGNRAILAVVKAGAYGHGAVRVSEHLILCGVPMLGVAFIEEAIELREAGIEVPIVVFFEGGREDAFFRYSLIPVLSNLKSANTLSSLAARSNRVLPVYIKVDTGMGRIGLRYENALSEIMRIADIPNLRLDGLMSHFADAEIKDREYASTQLERFSRLVDSLKDRKVHFQHVHIANSAAILQWPESYLNMVRPGIMLYGYGPARQGTLLPVLSLKSRIILVKKVPAGTPISYGRTFITKRTSTIATIPVGYADGYSRRLSNSGEVLVSGKRAPVVGRVCMDTIMADITDMPHVQEGDEAVLIGSQGDETVTAMDIAEKTGTIPYEVLTSIGPRVRRVYT